MKKTSKIHSTSVEIMALQKQIAEQQNIIDSVPGMIFYKDKENRIVRANRYLAESMGMRKEEIEGKTCFELWPDYAENYWDDDKEVIRTGKAKTHITEPVQTLSGKRWVETNKIPYRDEEGKVIGIIGFTTDITERKRMEDHQSLRLEILRTFHQHGSLKEICNNAILLLKNYLGCEAIALRLKTGEDYPYFVNNGFPAEFINLEDNLCLRGEDGERIRDVDGRPVLTCMCGRIINANVDTDRPFFSQEGSFWTNRAKDLLASLDEEEKGLCARDTCNRFGYESIALVPIKSILSNIGILQINDKKQDFFLPDDIHFIEELAHIIGMLIERKRAEDALRESEQRYRKLVETFEKLVQERTQELIKAHNELEKTKRLSDIGTLAATVAHELRNPLAAIRIAAFNIKRKKESPLLDKHLLSIEKKIAESDQIINNLLFYSRIKSPHVERLPLYDVLNGCISGTKKRFKQKKVNIGRKCRGIRNVIIPADPLQIQELFENILNNAYDAVSDKGGRIEIKAERVSPTCSLIRESQGQESLQQDKKSSPPRGRKSWPKKAQVTHNHNGYIQISFKDNGVGMSREACQNVFEPFYTTKSKGTGLGLTVCHQIINLNNGFINIQSKKGKGTEVSVAFPVIE